LLSSFCIQSLLTYNKLDNIHTLTPVSFSSTTLFKVAGHSITKLITVNSGRIEEKIETKSSSWYAGYGNFWRFNCKVVPN